MFSYNIVCTTKGRDTLYRLVDSLVNQLSETDIFTVISDDRHDYVKSNLDRYNFKCKVNYIKNENGPLGKYGHPLLNQHMNNLDGDFIMFADDDDRYTEDAFKVIKETVTDKDTLYVFRHKWYGTVNWVTKDFTQGNVGKCMGVIPNTHDLPHFQENVLGDVIFYSEIGVKFKSEFIDYIIYKVRETDL